MMPSVSSDISSGPSKPRLTRRRFLGGLAGLLALPTAAGIYGTRFEPFWLDVHEHPVAMPNLPRAFEGFRIAHLTDLHAGLEVPFDFLERVIERVNQLRPDAVVVTGDLTTHNFGFVWKISELLGSLAAPCYVCFGNHDYDPYASQGQHISSTELASVLEEQLMANGCTVLRNRSAAIERADGRLWIVGMEDLYSGLFDPVRAFADIGQSEAVIALSHNPDTAVEVDGFGPGLILCGHTHGGQVRIPLVGAPILPISDRRFDQGAFQLAHARLYVSRGVGYLKQIRFNCRPEVPVHVLFRAPARAS